MKILDPSKHTPREIDDEGTRRFEAFLDRNYPGWREREIHKALNAGTVRREWMLGPEDMETQRGWTPGMQDLERSALFRGEYIEVFDRCYTMDDKEEVYSHHSNHRLCAIDGDLTTVAAWRKRRA